jgi:LytS/YehU family sensor histidine kinase
VEWEISSDVLDFALPPMTLQPLVENALKHGLGGRLEGGTLQILARRHDATLTLRVRDDGIGFPDHYEEGTGLGNLRQRLATLYGEGATLRVDSGSVGATVELTIPGEQLLIA